MPFFSVIIPLFNKESYIIDTINSVLNQTFTDYEIIVINDGSTDNSLTAVKSFDAPCLRIISQENRGLSASRNRGFNLAKGDVIAFLDADDIWHPDFLKTIKILHDDFPEASIYGTSYFEKRGKKTLDININIEDKLKNTAFIVEDFFNANTKQFIPCQSSIALKKKAFKISPYNENITYHEDVDFYLKYCSIYKVALSYIALAYIDFSNENRMSQTFISSKNLPDLDFYQKKFSGNVSINKYIDIQRYKYIIKCKIEKNAPLKNALVKKINFENLSFTQKMMIKIPRNMLIWIRHLKNNILTYKIRLTTS